jgi:hypothetical protein
MLYPWAMIQLPPAGRFFEKKLRKKRSGCGSRISLKEDMTKELEWFESFPKPIYQTQPIKTGKAWPLMRGSRFGFHGAEPCE